jgi:hypothetical protein
MEENESHEVPFWFVYKCRLNIIGMRARKTADGERPAHVSLERQVRALLPVKECYEHYTEMKSGRMRFSRPVLIKMLLCMALIASRS